MPSGRIPYLPVPTIDFSKFNEVSDSNYVKAYLLKHYRVVPNGTVKSTDMYNDYMYRTILDENEPIPKHAFYRTVLACGVPRRNTHGGYCFYGLKKL